MTRFLAKLALFALAFLLVAVPVEGLIEAATADHIARKYRAMFAGGDGVNAIVIGSSRAAHGIDPWALDRPGLHWFNYAYNGSGPTFQRAWYDLYRKTHPAPAVVLIGIDWFMLGPDLSRRVEHDAAYLPLGVWARLLADHRYSRSLLLADRLALATQRDDMQVRLAGGPAEKPLHPLMAGYHDGFVPLGADHFLDQRRRQAGASQIVPEVLADFRALLARLRADHARVILVAPPAYTPLTPPHAADVAALVAASGAGDLPLLDFDGALAGPLNRDRENYCDWGHLSEHGAARFGPLLAAALEARGLLPAARL